MNSDTVWQLLRYLLIAAGGAAVQKGWLDSETLLSLVGAIGVLFTAAWGFYVKWNTRAVPEKTAAREDVPIVSSATGATIPGADYTGKQ